MEKPSRPILVTGGTGYVASHIILALLKEGYRVRTTVRSVKDEKKYSHLFSLTPNAKECIEIVEADLHNKNSWLAATKGCDFVIHTASPFPPTLPKDENEVIKPAVDGTLNVLNACLANNVRKVVLTSSIAAVIIGNENTYCTEDDWSIAKVCAPYEKSKLLAEQAAWEFYKTNKGKIELTVICPGLLWGPILHKNNFTSGDIVQLIMKGQLPAIPNISFPIADVRDAALAHVRAIQRPETNGRRYIIVSECFSAASTVSALRREFAKYGYRFPRFRVGKFLASMAAIYNPMFKLFIASIDQSYDISNKRSKDELGLNYILPEKSVVEMVHSMLDFKLLPDKRTISPKL